MRRRLPGLVDLDARNPGPLTGSGNHTWLLTGEVPTLIDAGVGEPSHLDAIAAALGEAGNLQQVIVTHGHSDHASGVVALVERWPAVRLLKWPWPEADRRYRVDWSALGDGQTLRAGDVLLEVVHTPGHSPDHVCLWHRESRTVFGGDLLIAGSTVVIPGNRGGDLAAYLRSLSRVAALEPDRVLPAHGPVIDDPLRLIERYSAHRAAREREVLAAIAAGADNVEAVVTAVYAGLDEALRRVAIESAHAHIRKLRDEGHVHQRDGRLIVVDRDS